MRGRVHSLAAALLIGLCTAPSAFAQKQGGVLRQYIIDSPASMSIHEETTVVAERPMMAVMNNLVLFDQHVPQNSLSVIKPELATDWAWDEDGTKLTFHLRQGVKWHDGKPFTAADVKCTWDLVQGKSAERLRVNPRKAWYANLVEIVRDESLEKAPAVRPGNRQNASIIEYGKACVVHSPRSLQKSLGIGRGPRAWQADRATI